MTDGNLPPAPRLAALGGDGRRRAPRVRALSREAIVAAGLAIVDRDGLDALTMRSVAQALGTGAASLYAHVASKEELIEMIVEQVIGEIEFPGAPDPDRWVEQLKALAHEMRAVFARHRDLARATFGRIPLGENALRGSEWMIAVMRAGGLADQVIAYACDLLPGYIMAIAYEEGLFASAELRMEEMVDFVAQMREYFAALPVDRFPNVVSLAAELTAGEGEVRFDFGLEVLIRGLEAVSRGERAT
jgi:AcrR family transcriptional regulator